MDITDEELNFLEQEVNLKYAEKLKGSLFLFLII